MRATFAAGAVLVALVLPGAGHASRCNDSWNLHAGSCGGRVKGLQWLLGGHRPNVFSKVKPTFRWEPNGFFGARTKAAVRAYKYRIGYPREGQCGAKADLVNDVAGPQFFAILEGRQTRPACWVALVSGRLKAVQASTLTADAIRWVGLVGSQVGHREQPPGSNRGPYISYSVAPYPSYQAATGAYGQAWCVSFQQWASLLVTGHSFANRTAGVYYAVDYYAARNLVFAKAKVGSLVAFITYNQYGHRVVGTGHMGFVTAVTASGFTYVAGNDSNAVSRHTIGFGSRPYLFIYLPGLTRNG